MKLSFVIITISAILLANSFAQASFGFGDYDLLHKWGEYGPTEPSSFAHPQFVAVGDDVIKGNSGNDILKGQSGIDIIYANSGSDVIDGGENSDRCHSESEKDLLLNCEQ